MKKIWNALLAVTCLGLASPAAAADIIYTAAGQGAGTFNGQSFSGAFTITSVGDTATRTQCVQNGNPVAGCHFVINSGLNLNIASLGNFAISTPSISFVNNASSLFGFSQLLPGPIVNTFAFMNLGQPANEFATWDGVSDLGPINTQMALNNFFTPFVITDGGLLRFSSSPYFSRATFTAQLQSAAVPEPATWMMLIAGVAAIGMVLRRREAPRASAA